MTDIPKNYLGAGLISIAVVLFWVLALPTYNKITDLDVAIKEREEMLSSRKAIMENIKKLNAEYQKRIADITKLSEIVPSKKSLAEVVSAIEAISSKNGVQLFSSSMTGQKSEDPSSLYNVLALEMALNGNYISLVNFLKGMEKNLRLVDISAIDAAATDNSSFLNFVIKGNAYYLK